MSRVRGLVPADVGRMTLPEIAVALDDENRDADGTPNMTDQEILDYIARRKRMTPLEKLRAFRR